MLGKSCQFILLALAICLVPVRGARAENVSLLFNDSGYMPFFTFEHDRDGGVGAGRGMLIDFFAAFEAAFPEHRIHRVVVPRRRANAMAAEGLADGYALQSPMFVKGLGDAFVCCETIWSTGDFIWVRADDPGACVDGYEHLEGKLLGLVSGYGYGPLDPMLRSGAIRSQRVTTHEQMYKLLQSGRVDAIVDSMHVLPYNLRTMGASPSRFKACPPPLYSLDLSVAVAVDKKDFIRDLNRFILDSRANGLLARIEGKWVGRVPSLPPLHD